MGAARGRRCQVVEGWEQLPAGYTHRDCLGMGIDSQDNVYVVTRNQSRVLVYSRQGEFLRSWGDTRRRRQPLRLCVHDYWGHWGRAAGARQGVAGAAGIVSSTMPMRATLAPVRCKGPHISLDSMPNVPK